MFIIWSLFIIYIIVNLCLSKFDIVPQFILVMTCFAYLFGLYIYERGKLYWLQYFILAILFIVISLIEYNRKMANIKQETSETSIFRFDKLLFFTTVFFIFYHYIVGGIPILQKNIMVSRFNMTSSGLFGIPGRMVQYGPSFLFYYSSYFYMWKDKIIDYQKYSKYFYFSIFLILMCAIFSGIKSGVLSLLFYFVYFFAFYKRKINIKRFFRPKFIISMSIVLIGGFFYFYFYFISYNNQYSNMNFWDYFYYRLTTMSAEAGAIALNSTNTKVTFLTEIVYYLQKYFHIRLTNKIIYPLELMISLKMNGVTFTNAYAYYTPVTIGGTVELIYHFGIFSILVNGLIALWYGNLMFKIKITKNPFKYAAFCQLIVVLNSFFAKGGLVYTLINYSLMYLIFYCIHCFGSSIRYTIKKETNIVKNTVFENDK